MYTLMLQCLLIKKRVEFSSLLPLPFYSDIINYSNKFDEIH